METIGKGLHCFGGKSGWVPRRNCQPRPNYSVNCVYGMVTKYQLQPSVCDMHNLSLIQLFLKNGWSITGCSGHLPLNYPGPSPLFFHTTSDQKLAVGMAWNELIHT